ncbi:MAG: hypothetical protein U0326_20715 [Polyangiales bacterium]
MTSRTRHLALCLVLAAASCSSTRGPQVNAPLAPSTALRVAPLRFVHAGQAECALSQDGTITLGDRPWARIEGNRVVSVEGRELLRIDGNALHFTGAASSATLERDGSILGANGQRMTIDGEGHPAFTAPDRTGTAVLGGTRVEGVTDATRPTAAVIVGLLMFRMREQRADAPESP